MSAGKFSRWGEAVQGRVFDSAVRVFVATEGMADLYSRTYNLDVCTVFHVYPEAIPKQLPVEEGIEDTLFWGGAVYDINSHSLARVHTALIRSGAEHRMVFATKQSPAELKAQGLPESRTETVFIPLTERARYLKTLSRQGVLVLALNWPDETHVHEDELSTIFPTKAPEYLASGRPIVVHCPEHYYLARFFRENRCGEVVSDRSDGALDQAILRTLEPGQHRNMLRRMALETATMFSRDVVVPSFVKSVQKAIDRRDPASGP
jgi:hypothetical protein